jgi:hypothetical protein
VQSNAHGPIGTFQPLPFVTGCYPVVLVQPHPPIKSACVECDRPITWVESPTGGWWAHDVHPADDHDADPPPDNSPEEIVNGRGEYVTVYGLADCVLACDWPLTGEHIPGCREVTR